VIGAVAARVAFMGARDRLAGMPGAIRVLLARSHGSALVWGVAIGLAAYALWRGSEVFNPRRAALARVDHAIGFLGYAALAWGAVRLLLHVRGRAPNVQRAGVEWLLSRAWGSTALTAIGIVVMAGGAYELYQGLSGRLRQRFTVGRRGRRVADVVLPIARVGLAARGVVFLVLGMFVIQAARKGEAGEVRGIGGALGVLTRTALGPALMGVIALGLIAYGVFMGALSVSKRVA
jgi:hypothetical protein